MANGRNSGKSNRLTKTPAIQQQGPQKGPQQQDLSYFPTINDVPTQAVTMGLKPIMTSKRIIIMGKGEKKKDILLKALHGDVTEKVPASILQKHKNVEVIYCD